MKSNLAYEQQSNQGEVVQFPKQERQVMSDKDEGFTPMPNFICDEGYLAAMSGDAFKCLYFLNRYIKGFHLENKSMSEALLKKLTGIKDNRTTRKGTAELENFHLIKIEKTNGKSHSYSLTYSERSLIKPVASNVPTTSDMACHPDKEIYLNKTLNKTQLMFTILSPLLVACQSNSIQPQAVCPQLPKKPSLSTPIPTVTYSKRALANINTWQNKQTNTQLMRND